jgi:peptide/nickel transport system ATP-binding protein
VTGPSPALAGTQTADAAVLEARGLTKHFRAGTVTSSSRPTRVDTSVARRFADRRAVVHAVDDVWLALPAAGITAIVGESGSGKSTLAKLLARLLRPTAGSVLLDGRAMPPSARVSRDYARNVQLVLQDPFASLNPVHDVRYHLARPLKLHGSQHGAGIRGVPDLDEAVASLLQRVALTPSDQFASKYPHELSGGQRQRVAIARALAVAPRVLLADEPVSMLDVSIRLGVLNLLADLREREGMAVAYVTHDIASARYLADDIAVMYAGRIVESGPADTLTSEPAHPYTQLLLSAAPDPDRANAPSLRGRGSPPNLVRPPTGCRFHPRCPDAMRVCAQRVPELTSIGAGHVSACWLHESGLDRSERAALNQGARPRPAPPSSPTQPGKET